MVAVKETFRGQLIWEGAVSLFEIYHQPGSFIYAWSVKNKAGDGAEHVTVKGEGKIDSPIAAVRAWMVSQAKQ